MSKFNDYIKDNYDGNKYWFTEEVRDYWHTKRILSAVNMKEYLDGKHDILKSSGFMYKGKMVEPTKIVFNQVKPILTFTSSFLLKNPVTLVSDDEKTLERYKEVYKTGKYNDLDIQILDKLLKYGEVYEYVYLDENNKIKSKLIDIADSYPIYNRRAEYIGFVEHYTIKGISYYTVFSKDEVVEYSDKGGEIVELSRNRNLTGLPVLYILPSEVDELVGKSEIEDYIGIINNMERLVSKYFDSFYKFLDPIPVASGDSIRNLLGEGFNENVAGQGIHLDPSSEFYFVNPEMDYESLKEVWDILYQQLLNISSTPSIINGGQSVANLSEESIRMMFYMAIAKGTMISKRLEKGFDQRFKYIKKLINKIDKEEYVGYVSVLFKFDVPSNETSVVDNLAKLRDVNLISTESALEHSPYTYDVDKELSRLADDLVDSGEEFNLDNYNI